MSGRALNRFPTTFMDKTEFIGGHIMSNREILRRLDLLYLEVPDLNDLNDFLTLEGYQYIFKKITKPIVREPPEDQPKFMCVSGDVSIRSAHEGDDAFEEAIEGPNTGTVIYIVLVRAATLQCPYIAVRMRLNVELNLQKPALITQTEFVQ